MKRLHVEKRGQRGPKHPPRDGVLSVFFLYFILITPVFGAALAEVNKTPIEEASVQEAVQSYLRRIGHEQLSPLRMALLRKEVLKQLIEEELLYQEGLRMELPVSDEELETGLGQIRQRFQNQAAYDEALSKAALNLDGIKNGVYRHILIKKTWKALSEMTDADRINRLRHVAEQADIHIYEENVAMVTDLVPAQVSP